MPRTTAASVLMTMFLLLAGPSLAQTKGPNGGLVAGREGHQTELIVAPTELTVYLLHDNKPQATKGASIRLVIQEGGKNTTVALTEAGGKLVGKIAAPLGNGAIVVITGKDDHGDAISSRYVIK